MTNNTWQERFDKLYGASGELGKFLVMKYGSHIHHGTVMELVKDFISSEIALAKQEDRELLLAKVAGLQKIKSEKCNTCGGCGDPPKCNGGADWAYVGAYNDALWDVSIELKKPLPTKE